RANRWTFCADARNTASPVCEPVAYLCLVDSTADTRCTTNTIVAKFCADSANADTAPCGVNVARWEKYAYSVEVSVDNNGTPNDETDDITTETRTKATIEEITTDSDNTGFINLPVVEYDPPEADTAPGRKQRAALSDAVVQNGASTASLILLTLGNHKEGIDPAVNLLGEETDGAFFFNGAQNGRDIFYAGITPTTDLGAPLDMPTTATWHGRIRLYTGFVNGVGYGEDDFQLMINFAEGAGTLASVTTVSNRGNTAVVTIDGKFDSLGLVTGTTTVKTGDTTYGGLLTGLIGKEGAVGGFVADGNKGIKDDETESTNKNLFAGAFVANNKICEANPFSFRCRAEFDTARRAVVAKCIGDTPDGQTCAEAKRFICNANGDYSALNANDPTQFAAFGDYSNPFASLCDGDGTDQSIAAVKTLRRNACLADTPASRASGNCPTILTAEGVNTDIWTARAVEDNGTTKLTFREMVKKVYAENDSPTAFLAT
ncbi:MAG: hypothetical protein K8953_09295, partial [Proteobacteria bacterium]|nr:hypothetical protein [Pseudomonadota bacterium]